MNSIPLDEKDQAIAEQIKQAWLARPGMRVGDFVRWPNGELRRCSHDWEDSMQTSKGGAGSFYIGSSGHASFSGGLQPANPMEFFKPTQETMTGAFWFFHHGSAGAGRGRDFVLPCRVFRLEPYAMSRDVVMTMDKTKRLIREFGAGSYVVTDHIERMVNPPVLRDPNFF